MAALSNTVDSGSGASGDYASLNALEAAQEQDLTDGAGDTYAAICTTTGDNAADTTAVSINGWVTSDTSFIQIEAASGDQAIITGWDATRYRIVSGVGSSIGIEEDYVKIKKLQIGASADITGIALNNQGDSNCIEISYCRLDGDGYTGDRAIKCSDASAIIYIWNCIIEGWDEGMQMVNVNNLYVYNSIIYHMQYDGIEVDVGIGTVINCAVFLTADDFDNIATISHCASDDNDTTDATNVAESGGGAAWPDDFEDAAAGDFRLKSGSNLVGGGTDDPGSGLYSDDIEGTARSSPWDVGAYEYVAAGGGIEVLRRRRSA